MELALEEEPATSGRVPQTGSKLVPGTGEAYVIESGGAKTKKATTALKHAAKKTRKVRTRRTAASNRA